MRRFAIIALPSVFVISLLVLRMAAILPPASIEPVPNLSQPTDQPESLSPEDRAQRCALRKKATCEKLDAFLLETRWEHDGLYLSRATFDREPLEEKAELAKHFSKCKNDKQPVRIVDEQSGAVLGTWSKENGYEPRP